MAKLPKSGRPSDIAGGPFANVHSDEARRSGSLRGCPADKRSTIKSGDRPVARRKTERPPSRTAQPVQSTARTALQGSKRGSKGGKNPLAPSSNQFENLPTAITDTEAPVVILKPVDGTRGPDAELNTIRGRLA